ncbi:hypothetical protein SDJN03_18385, partial [Cucurbita argyrosperma subsp. sororia]
MEAKFQADRSDGSSHQIHKFLFQQTVTSKIVCSDNYTCFADKTQLTNRIIEIRSRFSALLCAVSPSAGDFNKQLEGKSGSGANARRKVCKKSTNLSPPSVADDPSNLRRASTLRLCE